MMAYIDTQYLGKCETCRHHRSGSCNTFCDCGEEYSPDLSKIPTADVVPKSEVEELKAIIADHKASEERWEELYSNTKAEVAREISRDIIEPLWEAYKDSESKETVLLVALICESINFQLKKKYTDTSPDDPKEAFIQKLVDNWGKE